MSPLNKMKQVGSHKAKSLKGGTVKTKGYAGRTPEEAKQIEEKKKQEYLAAKKETARVTRERDAVIERRRKEEEARKRRGSCN
jgi:hypothetical protein